MSLTSCRLLAHHVHHFVSVSWLLWCDLLFTSLSVSLSFGSLLCDLEITMPEFISVFLTQGHWPLCGLWEQL